MKVSTVIKPAMLFAAGSVASVANAQTTPDDNGPYRATIGGTQITLAGSFFPQYRFAIEERPDGNSQYVVRGLTDIFTKQQALITTTGFGTQQEALNAANGSFGTTAVTGVKQDTPALAAFGTNAVTSDSYYGLRFASGLTNYRGFAGVTDGGATINQIEYEALAAAVPEPETWALMIAGFGGVGLAMRRRRRQASAAAVA